MSARLIFDHAPLGSMVRFSNGVPRPPARFTRKVRAWENDNGTGCLVQRLPASPRPGLVGEAGFYLHIEDHFSGSTVIITVRRHYGVRSLLRFEIVQVPKPGMVRVLTSFQDRDELRFLARDMASAQAWMDEHRYSEMRAELVIDAPTLPGRS